MYTNEKIAWIPTSPAARSEGHVPAPSTNELRAAGFAPTPERPRTSKKAEPKQGNGTSLGVNLGGGGGGGGGREEAASKPKARPAAKPVASKPAAAPSRTKTKTKQKEEGGSTWFLVALLIAALAVFISSVKEDSQLYPVKQAMDGLVASGQGVLDRAVESAKGLFGGAKQAKKRWGSY